MYRLILEENVLIGQLPVHIDRGVHVTLWSDAIHPALVGGGVTCVANTVWTRAFRKISMIIVVVDIAVPSVVVAVVAVAAVAAFVSHLHLAFCLRQGCRGEVNSN